MSSSPKRIKVGNKYYQVKYIDDEDAEDYGSFLRRSGRIRINISDDPIDILDTYIHELLHGVYDHFKLKPKDDEERVVSTLATGLTQILKDNPSFYKYIGTLLRQDKENDQNGDEG